jgi:hypothetical protein
MILRIIHRKLLRKIQVGPHRSNTIKILYGAQISQLSKWPIVEKSVHNTEQLNFVMIGANREATSCIFDLQRQREANGKLHAYGTH